MAGCDVAGVNNDGQAPGSPSVVLPEPFPMPWPDTMATHATAVTTMPGSVYEVYDFPEPL